jgi:RNA polymerase sigma factor (sigma-70 family)
MSDRPVPPQQGDEHELFERYSERLRRATKFAINTSPEIVDDACAFAWMKLISNQPQRGPTLFAWLRMVARNEAIRLDRLARGHETAVLSLDANDGMHDRLPATQGRAHVALGFLELRERLAELSPRQREIVFLSASGWRYDELAERLGISDARVGQVLSRARERLREMDARAVEPISPRARRLREIENQPPQYIVAAIGREPRAGVKHARNALRREWKRLVLEIEDYRDAYGIADQVQPLVPEVSEPRRDGLRRRIATYRRERGMGIGIER